MDAEQKNKSSTARKLRELRVGNGMSQTDVAKELGISQQTYSKYENLDKAAPIDSDTIKKICALYGVSADYLLDINTGTEGVAPKKMSSIVSDDVDMIVRRVLSKLGKTE